MGDHAGLPMKARRGRASGEGRRKRPREKSWGDFVGLIFRVTEEQSQKTKEARGGRRKELGVARRRTKTSRFQHKGHQNIADSMALDNRQIAKDIILEIVNEPDELVQSVELCIYKVPENLRKENEDAYTPHLISIGPIHHNNEKLEPMEKQKYLYFKYFCQQLSREEEEKLVDYTTKLGEDEENIRKCYLEKYISLDKKQFVHMMVLDAVFIMELFLRKKEGRIIMDDDLLFTVFMLSKGIERDLLLIENQIPFSILKELYQLVPAARREGTRSFLELARIYFKTYDSYHKLCVADINSQTKLKPGWDNPKHFVDLIRNFSVPMDLSREPECVSLIKSASCATKLKGVGITFEPVSDRCLFDIKFKERRVFNWLSCFRCCPKSVMARMQIPILKVDGSTESVLRNLMAFEQCHYPSHHYVCSYVALIDYLIDNEQDVDVLVDNKVVVHDLGSNKDVADLINNLGRNVFGNDTCYGSLAKELDQHHNFCNKTLAQLWLVYFPDLWRGTGTIIGIIALAFTVATFYKTVKDLLK